MKQKNHMQLFNPSEPLFDTWGTKFNPDIHLTSRSNPVQDKDGRFKLKPKVKKELAEKHNQSELPF